MKKILFLFSVIILMGCKETIDFKYTDRDKVLNCKDADNKLMQEALYSFQDDIGKATPNNRYKEGTPPYYKFAYANYIYKGVNEEANYQEIASLHSIAIADLLHDDQDLWVGSKPNIKLNYQSNYVQCLIDNFDNKAVKQTFQNLNEANSLSLRLLVDTFMLNVKDAETDKDFALFIALDTYYRPLLNRDFSK